MVLNNLVYKLLLSTLKQATTKDERKIITNIGHVGGTGPTAPSNNRGPSPCLIIIYIVLLPCEMLLYKLLTAAIF